MKILLTGARGQLGNDLLPELERRGHGVLTPTRADLDLDDPDTLGAAVRDSHADWVIHCAALTDVDACERDPALARRVNRDAAGTLAAAASANGARMLQISTDYVFAGETKRPYREHDPTGPLNVYGTTKLEAERLVLAAADDALIVRTAWLFGVHGRNFVKTMLARLHGGERLRVVDDQTGSPTCTRELSIALADLIERHQRGLFHACNAGACSWFEFACAIRDEALAAGLLQETSPIEAVASDAFARPAVRPAYSALDCSKLDAALGRALPPWRDSLRAMLASLDTPLPGRGGRGV